MIKAPPRHIESPRCFKSFFFSAFIVVQPVPINAQNDLGS